MLLMMVNEIRILSSIDHPLFIEYIESFVDVDKGVVWYVPLTPSAVYQFEKSMNLNEIMFRLTYNNQHIREDNLLVYLVYSAIIGLELNKYHLEMLEMDPKNLV